MIVGGPGTGTVTPAFVHGDHVAATWHYSFFELMLRDFSGPHLIGPPVAVHAGVGRIAEGRNQCVQEFLRGDSEWLWFVDTDMGFAPDVVERLVAAADPVDAPIVGALCFGLMLDGVDEYHCRTMTVAPTMYIMDESGEFSRLVEYEPDTLTRVSATGGACLLVHRDILEKIRAEVGERWFNQAPDGRNEWKMAGEDISFCARAQKICGAPVYVHTGIKTAHDKGGMALTEALFEETRAG